MNKKHRKGIFGTKSEDDSSEPVVSSRKPDISKKQDTKIDIITSSCLNHLSVPANVLVDDDSEWISNGDHRNTWIKLVFQKQRIEKVSYADRRSSDATMVSGILSFYDKDKEIHSVEVGLSGEGDIVTHTLEEPLCADSVMLKAGNRVWGKEIGLRYFNINQQ